MAVLFRQKVLGRVLNNLLSTHYSEPEYNLLLGNAEAYHIEVKGTNVQAGTALNLSLEISNDGVNWFTRTAFAQMAIATTPVQFASEQNYAGAGPTVQVGGCYARFGCQLAGTGSNAYIELIVEGRDGA